ncbi:MAG: hypothetical protein ABR923_12470 [Terracidiphilus sp.]|jgi:hypothetical protein
MFLWIRSALPTIAVFAVCCAVLPAQSSKTITIRIMDGRTGKALAATSVLIRVDHQKAVHPDWVALNEDRTGTVTLPADAKLVAAQGTYDNTMELYVNCDAAKDDPPTGPHWYKVSDILATGVVTPNSCSHKTATAKPGEFVVFARIKSWRDRYEQDFSE